MNCIYSEQCLMYVDRMFSMIDRDPFSKTRGCADRNYWSWKFTDFPGARFQESAFSVAWLYSSNFNGNKYFKKNKLLLWYSYIVSYWASIQNKDGSFDEAYPNEKSLAGTAFSSFYVAESLILLKDHLDIELRKKIISSLERSGDWLCKNNESHGFLSNHQAVAAASLFSIWKITKKNIYLDRCNYFVNNILNKQSIEGWYEEYGGADIGYLSHGLFYLAIIWKETNNVKLLKSLNRATNFFSFFIHPNKTIGGEYSSRNTNFYYPAAFEILSEVDKNSRSICSFMMSSIANKKSVGIQTIDLYNFFPILNNYMFSTIYFNKKIKSLKLPFQNSFTKLYKEAGIFIHSSKNYYLIFGISKGGVIKVYCKKTNKLIYSNSGYVIKSRENHITSQAFIRDNRFYLGKNKIQIKVPFVKLNQELMNPFRFILFRTYNLLFCRNRYLAKFIKNLIVTKLVTKFKITNSYLTKEIIFSQNKIILIDNIYYINLKKNNLFCEDFFTTIHMGSSKYFQIDELENKTISPHEIKYISNSHLKLTYILNI